MDIQTLIESIGKNAHEASRTLARAKSEDISFALNSLSDLLLKNKQDLLSASEKDLIEAKQNNMSAPNQERLTLTSKIIDEMSEACIYAANYPHPIGVIEEQWQRPNGLVVGKMRVPLGVIAMIYEARPNVTIDAAILCLRAGNAVILRGGSEAIHANTALANLLQKALQQANLPLNAVQLVPTTDRAAVTALCKLNQYIDVIIPRGGENLVHLVTEQATMPVLKHFKGVCHLFVDKTADMKASIPLIINSKVQRPSACNALECLLVHQDIANAFLPDVVTALIQEKVEVRACEKSYALLSQNPSLLPFLKKAQADDFGTEFHDLILAVKIVDSIDTAIDHIATYGSNHTEGICTQDISQSTRFQREVDASLVLVNSSTRFNDGGQLGLGAEIGISTSKLHSYGVMGIKELTTTKYTGYSEYLVRN